MLICAALLLPLQSALAQFLQQGPKVTGPNVIGSAFEGSSVALSADGNTAIVGGNGDDTNKGAAWVYTRSGSNWPRQAKLVGTEAIGAARQGGSVSLSGDGNTAIVGGEGDNANRGAAWVFIRRDTVWMQQAKLFDPAALGAARQGGSVALSPDGDTAIVGGSSDDGNKGAAWVYRRSGSVWTQQAKLVDPGAIGQARQGSSVALSNEGSTAIVGGNGDSNYKGAAWIYLRSGSAWTGQVKLVAPSTADAQQGISVALSYDGNTAIVGGWGEAGNNGAAWVFTRGSGFWTQQGPKLVCRALNGPPIGAPACGYSVALSYDGNRAILGGYADNGGAGASWVHTRKLGVWKPQQKLVGTGATFPTRQGRSVALSGDGRTAIVGGHKDDGDKGAVWFFVQ